MSEEDADNKTKNELEEAGEKVNEGAEKQAQELAGETQEVKNEVEKSEQIEKLKQTNDTGLMQKNTEDVNPVMPNPPISNEKNLKTAFSGKLKDYLFSDRWTSYLAITVGLLLILAVIGFAANEIAQRRADQIAAKELQSKKLECKIIAEPELKYLNEQRDEIIYYSAVHSNAAKKFYGYFYGTFTIFSIFGALAAIVLAIIAKQGMDKASNHLLTVFFVSTAVVVLYQSFFGVFQQTKNLNDNAALSNEYARLTDVIDSYCVTGKVNAKDADESLKDALPKSAPTQPANNTGDQATGTQEKNNEPPPNQKITPFFISLSADEFIQYINWKMVKLKNSAISLDETKFATFDQKRFTAIP